MADLRVLTAVFEAMPLGVVLMDRASRVVFYNAYEERLSGRDRDSVIGKRFFDEVAPCTKVRDLHAVFEREIDGGTLDVELDFQFPRPHVEVARQVHLGLRRIVVEDEPYAVLFVQDVSAVRLVERVKDFLVRTLAHDVASPMMVLSGSLELLGPATSDAERAPLLADATDALERLRRMHVDMRSIARLQTAAEPIGGHPIDLGGMVREAIVTVAPVARSREVEVLYHAPTEALICAVDPELAQRALGNLVRAGVEACGPAETVTVRLAAADGRVTVTVEVGGASVAFSRRDGLFRSPDDGGGAEDLSLALVDLVAAAHGGSFDVETLAGGGTRLRMSLPPAGG